jgi:hypothetical protein
MYIAENGPSEAASISEHPTRNYFRIAFASCFHPRPKIPARKFNTLNVDSSRR